MCRILHTRSGTADGGYGGVGKDGEICYTMCPESGVPHTFGDRASEPQGVKNDQQKKRAAFRFGMTGNTEVCGHSFLNCETKEECRMRYIGLDVHKDNITACVLTSTGKPKFEKDFLSRNDP